MRRDAPPGAAADGVGLDGCEVGIGICFLALSFGSVLRICFAYLSFVSVFRICFGFLIFGVRDEGNRMMAAQSSKRRARRACRKLIHVVAIAR